jgi:hypothetical protein
LLLTNVQDDNIPVYLRNTLTGVPKLFPAPQNGIKGTKLRSVVKEARRPCGIGPGGE